jgi:FMN phosphatase YigB (HAD superfamily)
MEQSADSRFDALVFDLGKVIIDFDPMIALEKLNGKTPFSVPGLIGKLRSTDAVHRFESGGMATADFFQFMKEYLDLRLTFDEFSAIWSDIFKPDLILRADFFQPLRSRYRLILMSNTNPMHAAFLERNFPILHLFDARIFSHEVGAMKPAEKIYHAAAAAARSVPERLFYVDDVPAYVDAANKLGWTAVLFSTKEQLIRDMRSTGVHID